MRGLVPLFYSQILLKMKLITFVLIFCCTIITHSQSPILLYGEDSYATIQNKQKRQKWADVEIIAGTILVLGGTYLFTQDQFQTQGAYVPCFVIGGVLTIEGSRMLVSIGSKQDRFITRYARKKQRFNKRKR